jgi:hypothetical protein
MNSDGKINPVESVSQAKDFTDVPLMLYSERSINIATFLGTPVAAGFLIRRNFINLGNETYGKHTLFISIAFTIILFILIILIPEHIIDKIPNALFPGIYTLIVWFVVNRYQGEALKNHKKEGGSFYSAWKAAGVGLIASVVLVAMIFAYTYASTADFDSDKYDRKISVFSKNEEEALMLYNIPDGASPLRIQEFIRTTGIPAWERNLVILDTLDAMENIDPMLIQQNNLLRKYAQLRVTLYKTIDSSFYVESDIYEARMIELNGKIEAVLEDLNKLK